MADYSAKYGTSGNTFTITLASLAGTATANGRNSTKVDNSTSKFIDAYVGGFVKTAGSPTANTLVKFYVYGSADGGTTYSGSASGTDAAYSGRSQQLHFLGAVSVTSTTGTFEFGPWSVLAATGGAAIPEFWGIVALNRTGASLTATAADHEVHWQGVKLTDA